MLDYKDDKQRTSRRLSAPLLCWDVANPLLKRYQDLASNLETLTQMKDRFDWQNIADLRAGLLNNMTVIVTDRSTRILWVSDNFSSLTGYQPKEALGKTPAFLQGPLTSLETQNTIRHNLARAQPVAVKLLNYRKDGTSYWCDVDIHPLLNSKHECTHFIAFEKELVL